jgi:hypothetical protein
MSFSSVNGVAQQVACLQQQHTTMETADLMAHLQQWRPISHSALLVAWLIDVVQEKMKDAGIRASTRPYPAHGTEGVHAAHLMVQMPATLDPEQILTRLVQGTLETDMDQMVAAFGHAVQEFRDAHDADFSMCLYPKIYWHADYPNGLPHLEIWAPIVLLPPGYVDPEVPAPVPV